MQLLFKKIAELIRLARIDERLKKIARVLAIAVVFATTYMLILPAITLETDVSCGYEEHAHSDSCYILKEFASGEAEESSDDEYVLTCTLKEHTHSDECYITDNQVELDSLDKETQEIIRHIINEIDALPTYDEIDAKLLEFEENGDEDDEIEYLTQLKKKAQSTYYTYSILGIYQDYVTNSDKLYELEWLWSAENLGLNSDGSFTLDIYEVNNYYTGSVHPPIIIYGGSPSEVGVSGFQWWVGIVVDSDTNGNLYVSQINNNMGSSYPKSTLKASTSAGFVVFIWSGYGEYSSAVSNIAVGDSVAVNFNYKTDAAYSGTALGTVTFGGSVLEDKDNSDELHVVESADTYDLIKVNLYDYGANINEKYNSNTEYPGFQQGGGTHTTLTALSAWTLNFGDTVTADILAGTSGVTNSTASPINKMNTTNSANRPSENAMSYLLGDDGCPVLANGLSLDYLFTDNTYATKKNTDNINGLFIQDADTGLYHYNSHDNHAQFDAETDTFILYEEVISPNYMMYPFGNFFPFADIVHDSKCSADINGSYLSLIANRAYSKYLNGEAQNDDYDEYLGLYNALTSFVSLMNTSYTTSWSAKDAVNYYFRQSGLKDSSGNYITFTNDDLANIYTLDYDVPSDFYFGMEMEMKFIQPKDGLTGTTGQEPLNFYFTGDDDVWIYIDGVLFLDLSGIHRHVGGEIDFVNGKVHYYELLTTTGDVSTTPYKTETFAEILERAGKSTDGLNESGAFNDYSSHTLKFFYMERGSGSGVCRMNFNLPLVKDNTIAITKELDVDTENILGNPDYSFQVLKAVDGEKTEELFIPANAAYEVFDSSGNKLRDEVTDANGIITVKAGETAVVTNSDDNVGEYYVRELIDEDFIAQYGQVSVDGSSITKSIEGIHIGSESFAGYESGIKDILDGNTSFNFTNSVDTSELGALMLTKKLTGPENTSSFTFNVTIDGEALPADTPYILISEDGTQAQKTVEQDGKISLKAGESARIENILAGSKFSVTEEAESKGDYTLSYEESGTYYTTDGDTASSFILPASTVSPIVMTAVNSESGTSVTINGTKTLTDSDGGSYTYNIILQQVTDASGTTLTENGVQLTSPVVFSGTESEPKQNFTFTLTYYESQLTNGEHKFYYLIYEATDESLADVTQFDNTKYVAEITVTKTEDEITALMTALYKNGDAVSSDLMSADFTNRLTGQLTISKEVTGNADESQLASEFEFIISLQYNDTPLSGKYTLISTDSQGVSVQSEITFEDGIGYAYLHHGDTISIKGIPIGTLVTVTESNSDFLVSHSSGDSEIITPGDEVTLTVAKGDNSVHFYNHIAYVLPETGGTGNTMYIIGGLLICLSAVFLLCYTKKTQGKED
ncbi:MAG: LPXTG cell wall anchor domain-containing protein [Clostridia bacterium]|nr:LPXTG cell wall anchor domain-containing protein [Clostridia bacterium]